VSRERIVIVGGGPAALATVRAYRSAGGSGDVVILSEEGCPPYRRPPLSKEYLRGELAANELPIEPPRFFADRSIELRQAKVIALDAVQRVVETAAGERVCYDHCVVATGSRPSRLPVPGSQAPGVCTLRSLADADELCRRVHAGTRAVVVGSGFIGCEAAASLSARGLEVMLVTDEALPQAGRLGGEVGERITAWLRDGGVSLRLGAPVERIVQHSGGLTVSDQLGQETTADVVLMAVGVSPRVELAEDAGIELAEEGAIATDAALRTADERVWAAGDVACAEHPRAGRRLRVEHWGEALNHGAVVGGRLAGVQRCWDAAPGFWSTIASRTLKYVAWGDGFDELDFIDHGEGAFTVRYGLDGILVGVLTHDRDEDYERGQQQVAAGAAFK